jgi:hypothetical protein
VHDTTHPRISHFIRTALAAMVLMTAATACCAQSCALCYTQAASANRRMIQGLRTGILVLIVPPMFMSVGITVLAYRKRNQFRPGSSPESGSDW